MQGLVTGWLPRSTSLQGLAKISAALNSIEDILLKHHHCPITSTETMRLSRACFAPRSDICLPLTPITAATSISTILRSSP